VLKIFGSVIQNVRVVPDAVHFGSTSGHQSRTRHVDVLNYQNEAMEVVGHELLHPATAPHVDVRIRSLLPEELPQVPRPKSGCRVEVTLKPGLPLGPIVQTIRVTTNLDDVPTLDIPIQGKIVSDFRVVGNPAFFDSRRQLVTVPNASRGWSTSETQQMSILVSGPSRSNARLSVARVDPPSLQVSIASEEDKISVNNGRVFQYPMTITVAPNSVPEEFLRFDSNRRGVIVIATGRPDTPEVVIDVRFNNQ
jgi:hypothetical protein